MKLTFDEVGFKSTRKYKDTNGKVRQETRHFYQTLNPFNKNVDGTMKTREQIMTELLLERDAWLKDATREAAK